MKLIFAIIFFTSSLAFSQGFDWQRSSRLPFQIPKNYIGVNSSLEFGGTTGKVELIQNGIICCEYEDGSLSSINFGLTAERWITSKTAAGFDIGLSFMSFDFSTRQAIAYFTGDSLVFDNRLEKSTSSFFIRPKIKYRFYNKFNIGGKLGLQFNLSNNTKSIINALEPEEFFFENGTKTIEDENAESTVLNSFILLPELYLSYDIQLNYPLYVSPYLSARFSMNQLNDRSLRVFSINLGVNIYYGYD